jgi:DNA invertase Pin-like site-specific DNA recombinase
MAMLYGYARVSASDQKAQLQLDALQAAGCQQVFVDEGISGSRTTRPALSKAFAALKAGDVLVVWRLDRLGRSLSGSVANSAAGARSL